MLLTVFVRPAIHTKLKSVFMLPVGAAVLCFTDGDCKGLGKHCPHSKQWPGQAEVVGKRDYHWHCFSCADSGCYSKVTDWCW